MPWSTIALGSLLLIPACLKGGQEVQSPQPEKSNPPVKMEQRGRILGIGGPLLLPLALPVLLIGFLAEYLAWTVGFGAVALNQFDKKESASAAGG